MDSEARRIVNEQWCAQFGLTSAMLRHGGVHVAAAEPGARNEAMSFRLEKSCIVVARPPMVDRARELVGSLDADAAFTRDVLHRLVGPGCEIDGPSWHGYVTERTFRGGFDDDVARLERDDPRLLAFLREGDPADWAESGFPREPAAADPVTTTYHGIIEHGHLVGAGNMTEWRGRPADVGVLVARNARGGGLATRLAGAMVAEALLHVDVVRYRALVTNAPSLAVARRLGFEGYGANYRARLDRTSES